MAMQLRSLIPAGLRTDAPQGSKPSGSEVDPDAPARSRPDEVQPAQRAYLDTPVLEIFSKRFPWLLSLMLFQSVSGWVIEHFQGLIEKHVILAAFLTMLVGGGGNSSGQTVAELVKRMGSGELTPAHLPQVLAKEVAVGSLLAVGLAVGAYPRVRLLSSHATDLDALAAQNVESARNCRLGGAAAGHSICKAVRCLVWCYCQPVPTCSSQRPGDRAVVHAHCRHGQYARGAHRHESAPLRPGGRRLAAGHAGARGRAWHPAHLPGLQRCVRHIICSA